MAPSQSSSKSSLTQSIKHTKKSKDVGLSSSDDEESGENDNSSSSVSSSPPTAGKIDQRFRSDNKAIENSKLKLNLFKLLIKIVFKLLCLIDKL